MKEKWTAKERGRSKIRASFDFIQMANGKTCADLEAIEAATELGWEDLEMVEAVPVAYAGTVILTEP